MAKQVLVVLTSADKIVKLDKPTGWYLVRETLQAELRPSAEIFPARAPRDKIIISTNTWNSFTTLDGDRFANCLWQPELAHPYDVLAPKAEIVVASPKGGIAPLDPSSIDMFKSDESSVNFLNNHKSVWENTTPLKEFIGRSDEFDALFYPGGHGPMYDLVTDQDSIKLIEEFYNAGKPVAAVCHGPIVFRDAKGKGGEPLLKGKNVTGFTNVEEDQVQLSAAMPFLLEDELKRVGANFHAADQPWGEKVVVDGLIISGQNPASAKAVGEAIAKAIGV